MGIAGRGLRGSLRKESADRSHQRAARSLAGWRCWENGGLLDADVFVTAFIAVASSGRGVGLERGDASHTGGVPAAGTHRGARSGLAATLARRGVPLRPRLEPVKGSGTWSSWGGCRAGRPAAGGHELFSAPVLTQAWPGLCLETPPCFGVSRERISVGKKRTVWPQLSITGRELSREVSAQMTAARQSLGRGRARRANPAVGIAALESPAMPARCHRRSRQPGTRAIS